MPNKPMQEKRTCSRCRTRTRRWSLSPDGTIICHECARPAEPPQDAPEGTEGVTPAQAENAQQRPADEAVDAPAPASALDAAVEAGFRKDMEEYFASTHPHEARIGLVEEFFEVALNAAELQAMTAKLPGAYMEVARIQEEKAKAMRDFGLQLRAAAKEHSRLARAVYSGILGEVRQAEVWLDRNAQRVNYRDPITKALFKSREVQPGEQLLLPFGGSDGNTTTTNT